MNKLSILFFCIVFAPILCWDSIPLIPTNRRTQFYLRNDDGAYQYGYDSGDGLTAQQKSSADNQVEGFYSFPNADGRIVNVKYTAGVQGFVPKTLPDDDLVQTTRADDNSQTNTWKTQNQQQVDLSLVPPKLPTRSFNQHQYNDANTNSDASYQISYNTGNHAREENSDANGNVKGRYSYVDEAGEHDLSYIAGPKTGYQVTGGSLSNPNRLHDASYNFKSTQNQVPIPKQTSQLATKHWASTNVPNVQPLPSASYAFNYNTGEHSRTESSDGSLSQSNGYADKNQANLKQNSWSQAHIKPTAINYQRENQQHSNQDGSAYAFSYKTDSHSRQESSDASGRVRGSYAVQTDGGHQQVSFETGNEDFSHDKPAANFNQASSNIQQNFDFTQRSPNEFNDQPNFNANIPSTHRMRIFNHEKSAFPTYTIIIPTSGQKSFEYGPKHDVILGYLPPRHSEKHGYIYDTQT